MRATHVGKDRSWFFPLGLLQTICPIKYFEEHGAMLQVTVSTSQSWNAKLANFERRTDIE
jgi:hypothetical protein